MKKNRLLLIISAVAFLLTGCLSNAPKEINLDATIQSALSTAILPIQQTADSKVGTSDLDQSQSMQSTQIMDQVQNLLSTSESVQVTQNLQNSNNMVSIGTATPTMINVSGCTDKFYYVSDVTVPDGATTMKSTIFKKSWYVQNAGTCTWNSGYKIVYSSGAEVGTAKSFSFLKSGEIIKPGESVVISAELQAPENYGSVETYWAMEDASGNIFGGGDQQNVFLSAKFTVSNTYNFYENISGGVCYDDSGYFYCGSSDQSTGRGSVFVENNPIMESNFAAGHPAILIAPPTTDGGKTRVELGPIRVPMGTWLRSAVSCRSGAANCHVKIAIYAKAAGQNEQWIYGLDKFNDGFVNEVNIKMSDNGLYNEDITYIFEVTAVGTGNADDTIIFMNPRLTDQTPVS